VTGSEFAPVVFGLASAAFWGAGDFCGGLATRRTSAIGVIIASQIVGVILLIGLALAFSEKMPQLAYFIGGGVGGLAGTVGLLALYRALATGRMGLAAPVSGLVGAIVPIVFGAFAEGLPDTPQLIGFGLALLAVWFISRAEDGAIRVGELGLPILAGLSFGVFFIIINRVSDTAVLWPLVGARLASLATLITLTMFTRRRWRPEGNRLPLIALVGVMEVGGNAFFALAGQVGRLDVAAVLSSLYPATTVWLAWLILKERFTRLQSIGIVAALVAIGLIAS